MPRRKLSDDPAVRAIRAHGYLTVQRAFNYAIQWAIVADRIGHAPTIDEYADWWKMSTRTAFRELRAFRTVTGLDDPSPVVERAKASGVILDDPVGGFALVPFMTWAAS